MTHYLFYIDGLGQTRWVKAPDQVEARSALWHSLELHKQEMAENLDIMDFEPSDLSADQLAESAGHVVVWTNHAY